MNFIIIVAQKDIMKLTSTHNNNNISKSLSGKYSTCVLTYYKSQNYIEIFVFTKNYSKTYLIISEISGK